VFCPSFDLTQMVIVCSTALLAEYAYIMAVGGRLFPTKVQGGTRTN
jgi:hypothetical protein